MIYWYCNDDYGILDILNHCISTVYSVYQLQIQEPLNVTSPKTNMLNPKKVGLECLEDGSSFLFRGPFSGSTMLVVECLLFLVGCMESTSFSNCHSFVQTCQARDIDSDSWLPCFMGFPRCRGHLGRIPRCLVHKNGVLKEWDFTESTWNIVITYSWDQESFQGTSKKWCFWVYWIFCCICLHMSL